MKKLICFMMALVFAFSFSACNGNSKEEETTAAVITDFPIEALGKAYTSGNGAVYDEFVNDMSFKAFNFEAIVDKVEDLETISCDAAYWDIYENHYGLRVQGIDLKMKRDQQELLKTLKPDDKIEFVGTFDKVWIYDSDYPGVTFINFVDVTIKTVNGTAV